MRRGASRGRRNDWKRRRNATPLCIRSRETDAQRVDDDVGGATRLCAGAHTYIHKTTRPADWIKAPRQSVLATRWRCAALWSMERPVGCQRSCDYDEVDSADSVVRRHVTPTQRLHRRHIVVVVDSSSPCLALLIAVSPCTRTAGRSHRTFSRYQHFIVKNQLCS